MKTFLLLFAWLSTGATGLAHVGRRCFPTAPNRGLRSGLGARQPGVGGVTGQHQDRPDDPVRLGSWARPWLADQMEKLIAQARQECWGQSQTSAVEKELGDFVNHGDRLPAGIFRRQGFLIGSGVVEAGGQTVIGARCKFRRAGIQGWTGCRKHSGLAPHSCPPPPRSILETPAQCPCRP